MTGKNHFGHPCFAVAPRQALTHARCCNWTPEHLRGWKSFCEEDEAAFITQQVDLAGAREYIVRVKGATSPSAARGRLEVSINGKLLLFDGYSRQETQDDLGPNPRALARSGKIDLERPWVFGLRPRPGVFQSYSFKGSKSFVGEGSTKSQLKIEAQGGEVWVDDIEVLACAT